MKTASWIIRDRFTGRVECETFVEPVTPLSDNLEAVPVLQHLQELNTPGTLARKWMMR